MYRSQLKLDLLHPSVHQALKDCNDMHRNLMRAFDVPDGSETRKELSLLYTVLTIGGFPAVYVVSSIKPDWSRVPGFYPVEGGEPTDISALKNVFTEGSVFSFRLFASPTKKVAREGKISGRVFLRSADERAQWLQRQSEKCGFSLNGFYEEERTEVIGHKGKNVIRYTGVVFTGSLTVVSPELFRKAYCSGIGPGKAYGLGMLMLKR